MENSNITLAETLHLHEIVMFKVLCETKASTMQALVQDEELKNMMEQDVIVTKEHLRELIKFLQDSPLLKSE